MKPILLRIWWIIPLCFLFSTLAAQQEFDVSDSPGELSAAHQDTPGIKSCSKCHNKDLEAEPSRCLACHKEIAQRISEARGYHRDKSEDCAVCHTSPHPGHQEKCQTCHSQKNWEVNIWAPGGIR